MSSQDRKDGTGGTGGFKRSEAVTLVLLTGAGAAAVGLARIDPSQQMEDIRIYPNAEACIAGRVRTAVDCRIEDDVARTVAAARAPIYRSRAECEAQHGLDACEARGVVAAPEAGTLYVPRMVAYFVGATAAQKLDPQPLFPTAGVVYGVRAVAQPAYRTTWGCPVTPTTDGGSVARVPVATARPPLLNGFGATGRSICGDESSASHHGGGG
ncbi:DUF1190 domain-containing protein [Methylobacterium sp. J-078]|uniref:DUF1190 domain-containing protein n=1 Tax=Methylobacterium sp. J-078 TaxID=2836657 RepID=UPI001FB8B58B|nr:DUF1190 domain-containing protein [Methylobacterium sp. J-078]MCJ2043439.1 DUF1190 domain-containing protein [Methylobacterium sp. J-078]